MLSLKQYAKRRVELLLARLVKRKLKRTQPTVIGITGSFGKTSTKEAVYEVLKTRWRVYRNAKSLNTEIGLLLAVLEQSSGFRSPIKWIKVFSGALWNAFFSEKHDFLILEYGVDKPGDIQHLLSIAKPHISIITHIAAVHQDEGQFKNAEEVFEEKKKLATCLEKTDMAILNDADPFLKKLTGKLKAKTFWFNGLAGNADLSADNLKNTARGFSATLHHAEQKLHAQFPVAGAYHIDVFLPALLCGMLHGISLKEGVAALQNFHLPPGRMSIIEGKQGSTLLDSTYNASPETMKQALQLLHDFPGKRKKAVLGNMNELGEFSPHGHADIGNHIGVWLDQLIIVGSQAALIAEQALKNGFPKTRIKILFNAEEAAHALSTNLSKGDVVLLKGSQNKVRLERAVKLLMAHTEQAKTLLCRQEHEWQHYE
ncbi:UDP-N-acetylmuramoyl-tripeptide--D-alanyl-D-alanine ligase [Candidatus Peregrinibacteria bacterium]|nr:UDP-N-acetylmuramoyl-tripeptide--D-alanyl-D-alanine ligase [Candidatus Peregrinibacteria bacterium]